METWLSMIAGGSAVAVTIVVHGVAALATLHWARHRRESGRFGQGFWLDLRFMAIAIGIAFAAHGVAIGIWAALFVLIGEFQVLATAFYHSAVNYTTLGYGDIVMSPAWRGLAPIEATTGLLMFGLSSAMLYAVLERLAWARFPDLRG